MADVAGAGAGIIGVGAAGSQLLFGAAVWTSP